MSNVSIIKQSTVGYPEKEPYNPGKLYPEFSKLHSNIDFAEENCVYDTIRKSFTALGFDSENFGTERWNPLSYLIKENDTVFIKPNMITHKHAINDDWDYVITHGSVIRVIVDYVFIAMNGKGKVIIGDGPQSDTIFELVADRQGLNEIIKVYEHYPDFDLELLNLQQEYWLVKDDVVVEEIKFPGDPRGNFVVNLGGDSYFAELDDKGVEYYGAHYNTNETNQNHCRNSHNYAIAKTPVFADVFINIPKLKTHRKCGFTANLKSLVGINGNKNLLPHYIFGTPDKNGDQFMEKKLRNRVEESVVRYVKSFLLRKNLFVQFLSRKFKKKAYGVFGDNEKVIRSGNWYGNNTVWRMCLDLNIIFMFLNVYGELDECNIRKKYLSVVDAIYSMEGDGPVSGDKRETGYVITGINPVSVDALCAKIMGFDYKKLPLIYKCFESNKFRLVDFAYTDIRCISNVEKYNKKLADIMYKDTEKFSTHFGWRGHIEESES